MVKTTLGLANGSEMLLDYRMHYTDARWQVYDVNIEGISLVANYRGQFNKIIRTSSYESLVTRLRAQQGDDSSPNLHRGPRRPADRRARPRRSGHGGPVDHLGEADDHALRVRELEVALSPLGIPRFGGREPSSRGVSRWSASTPRTRRITRFQGLAALEGASRRLMTLWPARIVVNGASGPP